MTTPELGKLEYVPVREIWADEARDFTPWLAENLDQLAAELEMSLELVKQEAPAGRFRLDILARDVDFGVMAAIENQLEPTNHNHLGQILTYAGNHDVRRLIWVAPSFSPEHRAALEWLNQWTDDEIEVYGVEVTAVRIGDSLPAPVFNKVVAPSDRVERTRVKVDSTLQPSDLPMTRAQFYSRFYRLLNSELADAGIYPISAAQGGWVARYRQYHSACPGTSYASMHDPPAPDDGYVYIGFRAWEENGGSIIETLREYQGDIERKMSGVVVDWNETDIWVSRPASYNDTEEEHTATRAWMFQNLVNLRNAVQPHLEAATSERDTDE